jgi:hypothetical protein
MRGAKVLTKHKAKKQPLHKVLKKHGIRWETSVQEDTTLAAIEACTSQMADMQSKLNEIENNIEKMDEELDSSVKYLGYKNLADYERQIKAGAKKHGMTFEQYEKYLIDKEDEEDE